MNQTIVTFLECNKQEWRYWIESNECVVPGMHQPGVALLEGMKQELRFWDASKESGVIGK
jgi:hypothetical protein